MKHKWHKEIKALADGAEIEHRYVGHSDYFQEYKEWNTDEQHNFFTDENWEYRIKPQPKRFVCNCGKCNFEIKQEPKEPQYLYVWIPHDEEGETVITHQKPRGVLSDSVYKYAGKIKLEVHDE